MASKAVHLRMAKAGRPVHCADGKWRTKKQGEAWGDGWADPWIFGKGSGVKPEMREHYIAGIVTRFKADYQRRR